VLVGGGWQWVLGWSKAANAACLAAFGPSTDSALSGQPECDKKYHVAIYDPQSLICCRNVSFTGSVLTWSLHGKFHPNSQANPVKLT
jgi:hypothetical protein